MAQWFRGFFLDWGGGYGLMLLWIMESEMQHRSVPIQTPQTGIPIVVVHSWLLGDVCDCHHEHRQQVGILLGSWEETVLTENPTAITIRSTIWIREGSLFIPKIGRMAVCRTRFWLLMSYLLSFGAFLGSIIILIAKYGGAI